jgi:hypothetical protein
MTSYDSIIEEASKRFGVPVATIRAVMAQESNGQPGAVSDAGAGGLMQIMTPTYNELRRKHNLGEDRFDPTNNIMGGAAYLRQMYDQFGSWNDALGGYNAGPGRWSLVKAGKQNAPAETTNYIHDVNQRLGNAGTGGTMAFSPTTPRTLDRPRPGQAVSPPGYYYPGGLLADQERGIPGGLLGPNPGGTNVEAPDPMTPLGRSAPADIRSRISELVNNLTNTPAPRSTVSPLQYAISGMQSGVQPLAGIHDRRVGLGEMIGAMGAGFTKGQLAGDEAQAKRRDDLFGELGGLTKLQTYQRTEATASNKIQAALAYAAQLEKTGDPNKIALAALIRRDPSQVDAIVGKQAEQAFPKPGDGFTIGNTRYDGAGKPIVTNPTSGDPFTIGDTRFTPDGRPIVTNPAPTGRPLNHDEVRQRGGNPQPGEVYTLKADGTLDVTKPQTTTRRLSPEETKQAGFPEGTVVQVDSNGVATKLADAPKRTNQLTTEEVAKLGLPTGTVVERDTDGTMRVVSRPTTTVDGLRHEFQTLSKPMQEAATSWGRMQAAYQTSSQAKDALTQGPADIAMIFSFMKMLDPGSSVMEGEQATARNAGTIPDRIYNVYNRLLTGGKLDPNTRTEMLNQARAQMDQRVLLHKTVADQYTKLATDNNIDPGQVVLDYTGGHTVTTKYRKGERKANAEGKMVEFNGTEWVAVP